MIRPSRRFLPWLLGWLALSLASAAWIGAAELDRLRQSFEADARIVHRLLSLRAVEHEAILATLALLDAPDSVDAAQRLPSIYPRIVSVLRRQGEAAWPDPARSVELAEAEAASRRAGRAWGLVSELAHGRLWVVLAAEPASHALQIDLPSLVPAAEWPFAADAPVRVELAHGGRRWIIQPGASADGGWRFGFDKVLTVRSQPFDVVAERRVGAGELPWLRMAAGALAFAMVLVGAASLRQQRIARRRAEDLLRLGQVGRLNALGELAAGMAHELNQPLTAILANARAADRMLRDEPPELDDARLAMKAASEQARRAADVLARMRRAVERPDAGAATRAVDLRAAVGAVLHLVEPELRRLRVSPRIEGQTAVAVMAEPVALEQIVHNLLLNALHALGRVPEAERRLSLGLVADGDHGRLTVADSGPGIPAAARGRIFEPFFTTREGGLGLGLSLCETLATAMDGALELAPNGGRGAAFSLSLPLAPPP